MCHPADNEFDVNDMALAAIQMNSGDDVQANCRMAGELLAQAAEAGAETGSVTREFCRPER